MLRRYLNRAVTLHFVIPMFCFEDASIVFRCEKVRSTLIHSYELLLFARVDALRSVNVIGVTNSHTSSLVTGAVFIVA